MLGLTVLKLRECWQELVAWCKFENAKSEPLEE